MDSADGVAELALGEVRNKSGECLVAGRRMGDADSCGQGVAEQAFA